MKRVITVLMIVALSTGISFAQKKEKKNETAKFQLTEMCENCVKKINNYVAFEKGVTGVEYDRPNMAVAITYNPEKTDTTKLKKAFGKVKLDVVSVKPVTLVQKK
ncbi:MAG: cation transporter [Dysgonamonadaceae bacterium]